MDVIEAIKSRKSIRAFKPDPVPKEILEEIMETALHAPSWANTQPWEFAIVGGKVLDEIRQAYTEKASQGLEPDSDIPRPSFSGAWEVRRTENGIRLFQALGIGREDREKRRQWYLRGRQFFGAPNAIILLLDRSLGAYSTLDMGIVLQTIMLAAMAYGLGTCPQAAMASYPNELRRILGLPESKQVVVGIAIGYPDFDDPANSFVSNRAPLETFVTWHDCP